MTAQDPLTELARLIGEGDFGRYPYRDEEQLELPLGDYDLPHESYGDEVRRIAADRVAAFERDRLAYEQLSDHEKRLRTRAVLEGIFPRVQDDDFYYDPPPPRDNRLLRMLRAIRDALEKGL